MSKRISAYVHDDIYDLLCRVIDKLAYHAGEPMSDSQAIRLAIYAWAKQEKVK